MKRKRARIKDISKLEAHGFHPCFDKYAYPDKAEHNKFRAFRIYVDRNGWISITSVTGDTLEKFAELVKADLVEFVDYSTDTVNVKMTKEEYERWKGETK